MRLVIVEDHTLLREGIVALLAEHEIEVVATAEDGPGLLRIVEGHNPDLAICDQRLPPTVTGEGIQAALEARRRHPELAVVVLSQYVFAKLDLPATDDDHRRVLAVLTYLRATREDAGETDLRTRG